MQLTINQNSIATCFNQTINPRKIYIALGKQTFICALKDRLFGRARELNGNQAECKQSLAICLLRECLLPGSATEFRQKHAILFAFFIHL